MEDILQILQKKGFHCEFQALSLPCRYINSKGTSATETNTSKESRLGGEDE